MTKKLKLDRDYAYSYPMGNGSGPFIQSLRGEYKGLTIHLEGSWLESSSTIKKKIDHNLHYIYNVKAMWNSYESDGTNKISLTSAAQEFIYALIFNYIRDDN